MDSCRLLCRINFFDEIRRLLIRQTDTIYVQIGNSVFSCLMILGHIMRK